MCKIASLVKQSYIKVRSSILTIWYLSNTATSTEYLYLPCKNFQGIDTHLTLNFCMNLNLEENKSFYLLILNKTFIILGLMIFKL